VGINEEGPTTLQTLYKIEGLVVDNCSENTGATGGIRVRVRLNELRKKHWLADEGPKEDFMKLRLKGCTDHITNISSKAFEKELVLFAEKFNQPHLITSKQHVATKLAIAIPNLLRNAPFSRLAQGFMTVLYSGLKTKFSYSFSRVDMTRFASVDISCGRPESSLSVLEIKGCGPHLAHSSTC
jgi:hypothetical protein